MADGSRRVWRFVELRLVFGCGKAGKAEVGGSNGGCDVGGRAVAIVEETESVSTLGELSTKETSGCSSAERGEFKRAMVPCLDGNATVNSGSYQPRKPSRST